MSNCIRCGKTTKDFKLIGPECSDKAWAELETFSKANFNSTIQEFADSCMSDFASDDGLTVEEYKEQYSNLGHDLCWVIETFQCHGLVWVRRGGEIQVATATS